MLENIYPQDAINCLVRAEHEIKKHNYLGAARSAMEAAQQLISCKERQDENLREVLTGLLHDHDHDHDHESLSGSLREALGIHD